MYAQAPDLLALTHLYCISTYFLRSLWLFLSVCSPGYEPGIPTQGETL